MDKPWDLFLSYARADDEASSFATELYELLSGPSYGFRVWFDRKRMPSRGRGFVEEIARAIAGSQRVLLVLGDDALRSDYVRAEWQYALSQELPVVPLLQLRSPPVDAKQAYALVPAELSTLHVENVCGLTAAASVDRIVTLLRAPLPKLGPLSLDLPQTPSSFEPRQDAIAALSQRLILTRVEQLTDPRRFVVLHGMSGVGKSVIATAFARSLSTRMAFGDGVLWLRAPRVSSGAMSETTGEALKYVLERQLAASPRFPDLSALNRPDAAMLLIVDDAQAAPQLAFLWDALGVGCRVLVTTQQAQLATAFGADEFKLEPLTLESGVALLARYSSSAPASLPKEAREVASLCGGIPFALAVAGALVGDGDSWGDLTVKLQSNDLQGLTHAIQGYPHPSVFAMLDVAVQRLPASEQALFRMLHVFADTLPVPEPILIALWGRSTEARPDQLRSMLTRLIRASLLSSDGTSPARSVRIHDLLIRYCRTTDQRGERASAADLLAARTAGGAEVTSPAAREYWQRTLLRHMDQADDADAAFSLLTQIDGNVHRWYAAKVSSGDFAGYLADVGIGWALQDRHTSTPDRLERLMLCALLATGSRAGAENVPEQLWSTLAASGVVPLTALRSRAMLLGDPAERGRVLLRLLAHAVGDASPWFAAIREAAAQSNAADRIELLSGLAGRVDAPALPDLLRDCTRAVDALQGAERSLGLARIATAPHLTSQSGAKRAAAEAFEIAVSHPKDPVSHEALVALLELLLPEQRREAVDLVLNDSLLPTDRPQPLARAAYRRRLSCILPFLGSGQKDLLVEALEKDDNQDPGALEAFASVLPEVFVRARWDAARAARKIDSPVFATQPLVEAVRLLSRRGPVPALVEEASAFARRETSLHGSFGHYGKPMALARLVEISAQPERTTLWHEAMSSAMQMTVVDKQVRVLMSLGELAPEDRRADVLRLTWERTLRVSDQWELFSVLVAAVRYVDRAGVDEVVNIARQRQPESEFDTCDQVVAAAAGRLGKLGDPEAGLSLITGSLDSQNPSAIAALEELVPVLPDARLDAPWQKVDCASWMESPKGANVIAQFVARRPDLLEQVIARCADNHGEAPGSWGVFVRGLAHRGLLMEALKAIRAASPKDTVMDPVLSVAAVAPDDTSAAQVKDFCAALGDWRATRVLVLLGPKLVGAQAFAEAVESLDLGPRGGDWYACGLEALDNASGELEVKLFDAGFESAQGFDQPSDRARALGRLISHVHRGAMDAFRRVVQAQASDYHRHFLKLGGQLAKLGLTDEGLLFARGLPRPASQARALCLVAAQLRSPAIIREALELCCEDASWHDRAKALSAIIELIAAQPRGESLELFKLALHRLASRGRPDLLMDCMTLVEWVSALGGSGAVITLVRTLNETTAAWM